jgi:hypothetical protein
MKPYHQFKPFQIRWKEAMGSNPSKPYLYRWTLVLFGYSIRLHHWVGSDEKRYFHDHPWNFISFLFKGHYANVRPNGDNLSIRKGIITRTPSEPRRFEAKAPFIWYSKATDWHYLDIPNEGAWTILLCSRPIQKWGFLVKGHKWRPLRFFHKFGGEKENKNPLDNVIVL